MREVTEGEWLEGDYEGADEIPPEMRDNARSRRASSELEAPASLEVPRFVDGECAPTNICRCEGHSWPGVHHLVACCDQPHITQQEFDERYERSFR